MRLLFVKISVVILAFILIPFSVFTQTNKDGMSVNLNVRFKDRSDNSDFILYNVNNHLKIKDFQGRPDRSSHGVGATFSGIQMSWEGKSFNGKMDVNVSMMVYFDKSHSWMKPEGKDERVLKHEQIHFDLTAIYACKMYHAILNEKYNSKNIKQKLRDIQNKFMAALQDEQALYDKETKHGTIDDVQKAWAEKVSQMKSELDCM